MRIEPFMPATQWYDRLRQERERRAYSRADLAGLANVSDETIFSYENRRRRPNRGTLLKLTRALELDTEHTNAILVAAGMEAEPSPWMRKALNARRGIPGKEELDALPWPCVVLDAAGVLRAGNDGFRRLAGELPPSEENVTLAGWLLSPTARTSIEDWAGTVQALLRPAVPDGADAGPEPPCASRLEQLASAVADGAASATVELSQLWDASALAHGERVVAPVNWRIANNTTLSFTCVASIWGLATGLWGLDWHPGDRVTWTWLS